MPPKAKSFEAFLKKGAARSRPDNKGIVNKRERRPIASGTEANYQRALGTWRAYQEINPGAKLDNYETPKDFMRIIAHAIDGRYNDDKACLKTVRQFWKNTTAILDREGEKVEKDIINSTTNFIKGPLQKDMELPLQKRARKYASMSVFLILGARLWGSDWYKYPSPKDRIDLWDGM